MKQPGNRLKLPRIFIMLFLVLAASSTLARNCIAKPKPNPEVQGDYSVSAIVIEWINPPIQTYTYDLGVKTLRLLRNGRYIAYCLPRDKNDQPIKGKIRVRRGKYTYNAREKRVDWLSGPFSPCASYETLDGQSAILTFNFELVYVTCTRK